MNYILLIVGFVLLVKGADFFVDGSSAIARYFKIPPLIIGLTIVAMGTSAPEAAVSITAAVGGQNGIAVGNVTGSNIFNLLIVLGACAIIKNCPVHRETLKEEFPLSIMAAILFLVFAIVNLGGGSVLYFSRIEGIILLIIFALFIINMIRKALKNPSGYNMESQKSLSLPKGLAMSAIGLAGIVFGGDLVVDSASEIAVSFGINQTLIGLTVVALGTSLPELVTSMTAAMKGETDIALGNVIGSNIFNILLVLGLSVTIHPVSVEMVSIFDAVAVIAASIIVAIPCIIKKQITRGWGILFVFIYMIYMAYAIIR